MFVINLIILVVLVVIAAICKAGSDRLIHLFNRSIFSTFANPQFWNPELSWKNKYKDQDQTKGLKRFKILGIRFKTIVAFSDAWHLFNTIEILCFMLVIFFPITLYVPFVFLGLGILHVLVFNLFYNRVFKK